MTVQDVIEGFAEGVAEDGRRDTYADVLFQEAVRIGMELNCQYHTSVHVLLASLQEPVVPC